MPWPLKVETDEPGRRLVLAGDFPEISKGLLAGIAAGIVLAVAVPTLGMALSALIREGVSTHSLIGLALGAFYPAAAAVGLVLMARRANAVTRLAIDRSGGRIEVREFKILGDAGAIEILRSADLRGITVAAAKTLPGRSSQVSGQDLTLTLDLLFRDASRAPRRLKLSVAGLDRTDEGSDFALRIASALGFRHQRVARSDPRTVEIEFSADVAPGFTALAKVETQAAYELDRVSEEAQEISKREELPAFEAGGLKADHRLETWLPGQEVRFHKPMSFGAVGCAPGLLLLLAGPVAFFASSGEIAGRLLAAGMFGVLGLFLGGLSLLVVVSSAAHTVAFDWRERRLSVRKLFSRASYDFSQLHAIELKCVRTTGKGGGSCYCRLSAVLKAGALDPNPPQPVEILCTEFYNRDPDTPYRMALPLATELAAALGIPRDVVDYN